MLDRSLQEILYRIDNWISERSGWTTESLQSQYVNVFIYSQHSGSTYIKLPDKLKHSKKICITFKTMTTDFFFDVMLDTYIHQKYILKR